MYLFRSSSLVLPHISLLFKGYYREVHVFIFDSVMYIISSKPMRNASIALAGVNTALEFTFTQKYQG